MFFLSNVKSNVSLTVARSRCGLFYGDVQHA